MAAHDWEDRLVADRSGLTFGRIHDVFVDKLTQTPELAIIGTDGGRVAVPLDGAREQDGLVTLPLDAARVDEAPRVRDDVDELPPEALANVRAFFAPRSDAPTTPMAPLAGAGTAPVAPGLGAPDLAGSGAGLERETAAPAAPAAEVVLSEEQVEVGTERHVRERVHLRKRIVTEEITLRVELQREELVVEREPVEPTALGAGPAPAPEALTDGEPLVITLYGEEPVLSRRIVPVERVVLRKDTVLESERIVAEVDREVAEVDRDPLP